MKPKQQTPDSPTDDKETRAEMPEGFLPVGSMLAALRIRRLLTQGADEAVYVGFNEKLQRRFTVREYLPLALVHRAAGSTVLQLRDAEAGPAFSRGLDAFLDRARRRAELEQGVLLGVRRIWEENGTAYLCLPFPRAHTLADMRNARSRPPDETWLRERLLAPLLGALAQLHGAWLLHGALGPAHVEVLPDGRTVLLDYASGPLQAEEGEAAGTEEQVGQGGSVGISEPAGPWTDVRALAELACYTITGTTTEPGHFVQALREATQRPGMPPYSPGLLAALEAALQAGPEAAVRSVQDFRDRLAADPAAPPAAAVPAPDSPELPPELQALAPIPVDLDLTELAPPDSTPAPFELPPVENEPAAVRNAEAAPVAEAAAEPALAPAPEREPVPEPDPLPVGAMQVAAAPPSAEPAAAQPPTASPARQEPPPDIPWPPPIRPASAELGPPGPPPATWPATRPPWVPWAWLLAVVLAAALAGWGGWWLVHRPAGGNPAADVAAPSLLAVGPSSAGGAAPAAAAVSTPSSNSSKPDSARSTPPAPTAASVASSPASGRPAANNAAAASAAAAPAQPAPSPPAPQKRPAPPAPAASSVPASPRANCGARTNFALYTCMQRQCKSAGFAQHPQCLLLKEEDRVE